MPDPERLLEDYRAYYALLAEKHAGTAHQRKAVAYARCAELARESGDLAELDRRFEEEGLAAELARAEIIDQCELRRRAAEQADEVVRAEAQQEMIDAAERCESVAELARVMAEAARAAAGRIAADEVYKGFHAEILRIEYVHMLRTAEVPEEYRADMLAEAEEQEASMRREWEEEALPRLRQAGGPGWSYDHEQLFASRNRRIYPMGDDTLRWLVAQSKRIKGVA